MRLAPEKRKVGPDTSARQRPDLPCESLVNVLIIRKLGVPASPRLRQEHVAELGLPRIRTDATVAKFVRAWESADLHALVALLTDDVFMSMPPMPFEYEGRDVAARFCASIFHAGRRFDLVPTRAKRPASFWLAYLRAANGTSTGSASTSSPSPETGSAP